MAVGVSSVPPDPEVFSDAATISLLTLRRPILTPKTVLPLFFVVGIIFAPIGGLLLYASAQVSSYDLDTCRECAS